MDGDVIILYNFVRFLDAKKNRRVDRVVWRVL